MMHYREDLAEFERRLLLRFEGRSKRRSEWSRLRRLQRDRQLYRLGLITLGLCFALLTVVVVFAVFLLLL
jgi:transposase